MGQTFTRSPVNSLIYILFLLQRRDNGLLTWTLSTDQKDPVGPFLRP